MSSNKPQLSPQLTTARDDLQSMLIEKTKNPESGKDVPSLSMEQRLQVIDRLIKIEALEHKMGTGKAGSAFEDD